MLKLKDNFFSWQRLKYLQTHWVNENMENRHFCVHFWECKIVLIQKGSGNIYENLMQKQQFHFQECVPWACLHKYMHTFIATLFEIAQYQKHPKY